jgi:two-component system OmpR family sensor kinase
MTLSLRGRLLLGLVALVVLGLAVSDVVTYRRLESFLLQGVDAKLSSSAGTVGVYLLGGPGPPDRGPQLGGPDRLPPVPQGTYGRVVGPDGATLAEKTFYCSCTAQPALPSPLPAADGGPPPPFTVDGSGGASQYRVLVEPWPRTRYTLVVAIPLTDVQSTLGQLLLLELTIGLAVLLGLAVLAWWIIRVGLRPLERMGATAGAIADGDLSRRVEPATAKTEIGRLGLALNGMLSQIESAFAERTRSEQRLRRFLADASHELRTPLTSIRGYAELLRRGAGEKPEDADLARRRIEQESIRMSILVDDLLLLARLDQGRPLDRARVDLQAIARDAAADARAVAPQRPIGLSAPEPVVVTGDDLRLRQVVGNLVRNALVHTPPGAPVEISVGRANGRAVLTVTDHGPGLGADGTKRVFEPFYRADPGRSRDRGGSGLGLSIVAAVVGAHDGRVEATETEGGGATFRVELPAG